MAGARSLDQVKAPQHFIPFKCLPPKLEVKILIKRAELSTAPIPLSIYHTNSVSCSNLSVLAGLLGLRGSRRLLWMASEAASVLMRSIIIIF